ncbi:MAG: LPS-assembly protein LptD, partial [Hyphomicrobiaceae bacterium]
PTADFTFDPRYWSKQGVLYQGEWRQKLAFGGITGQYNVKLAGIDQDASKLPTEYSFDRRSDLDGWRGSIQTKGVFSLASWWKFGWDVTIESDDAFRRFYKLDSILQTDRINTLWLQGLSARNHFNMQFYQFGGLLLDDSPASESRVHPVIDWNYVYGQPVLGGELSFNSNAQSISRSDGTDSNRFSFDANWRRKIVDGVGQVWTPFAYAKADVTNFTNGYDPNTGSAIEEDTISRGIGAVGVKYSFPFVNHTAEGSHVVEPVAQVVARPASVSQRRLPDEDAKSLVWDDTLLFDVDKFSGWDRMETGTRANVGLQYTFQANNGGYARFIAGQSYHLAGTNPYEDPGRAPYSYVAFDPNTDSYFRNTILIDSFSRNSGLETSSSDYVLGAYLAPSQLFRMVAQSRFDESSLALKRQTVYGTTTLGPLSLSGQYTFLRNDPQLAVYQTQQELLANATLKLTDRWSLGGAIRYDIDADNMLQHYIQLRYGDECFVLTATYAENNITNPDLYIKPDRTVMLRFELKHLGQFGYATDALDHIFGENQPPQK